MKKLFAVLLTSTLIIILLLGVRELPKFGDENNPANNDVMYHYIHKAPDETGAMNIVTGIILDYRAFDTFVEASVLFTAAILVIMVLKCQNQSDGYIGFLNESRILKEIGRILNPFIQIFGIYIIFFGHLSPGGGFAGGTIIGASFILYYIVNGKTKAQETLSYTRLIAFLCGGIILYGIFKGYTFITGGSHIKLLQLPLGTRGNIISGGMLLPLNILVGNIVAITMYFFFVLFDKGDI